MGTARWFSIFSAFLIMVALLCPLIRADTDFKPTMPVRPLPQDANNNGISDALDQEIADKIASGHGDDYVSVTVMLKNEPSDSDLALFVAAGGNVTAGPWKYAIYGFGGLIQYDEIDTFAFNCQDLVYMEKEGVASTDSIPEYTTPIVVLTLFGTALVIFQAKKIVENKKRIHPPHRISENP
jgi:hypothetical protein